MIYGEAGEIPIDIIVKKRLMGHYAKLRDKDNPILAHTIFETIVNMHNRGEFTTKWLQRIIFLHHELNIQELLYRKVNMPKKDIGQLYLLAI